MIQKELFGKMPNGEAVYAYTLKNAYSSSVKVITLGATLVSINVPDANNLFADVICGYEHHQGIVI